MDYRVHGILQAKITGLGSLSLLQGIFPTQGSKPGLPHCRQILYQLSYVLTVWITTNWKILQEMGIPDHLTYLLRNLYAGQEETELDMEYQTDSKLGKEYIKAIYCNLAYLTYMQSI